MARNHTRTRLTAAEQRRLLDYLRERLEGAGRAEEAALTAAERARDGTKARLRWRGVALYWRHVGAGISWLCRTLPPAAPEVTDGSQ